VNRIGMKIHEVIHHQGTGGHRTDKGVACSNVPCCPANLSGDTAITNVQDSFKLLLQKQCLLDVGKSCRQSLQSVVSQYRIEKIVRRFFIIL